jgi:dTDP-4-amino-4,6-dideoxygalactose transaminase
MRDLLDNLPARENAGVLLPGYIGWSPREGSGVCDPVRESGRHYDFYDLQEDLSLDLASLKEKAASGLFQAIVVIHYFGRVQGQMPEVEKVAKEHDLVVIEDLAHGLYTAVIGRAAGVVGDANLFSLHKMLPTGGGGMVTYRNRDLAEGQSSSAPEYAFALASYDLWEIAARRRRNFELLTARLVASHFHGESFSLLWPVLAEGEVPQSLPALVLDADRDAIYAEMNAQGFGMVSLYHTLIPGLPERFPSLDRIAQRIINFPIHQDVQESDIEPMVQLFEASLTAHA